MGRTEVVTPTQSIDVISKGVPMASTVQRRPTVPMSKRDSLVLNGSRLPLVSSSSSRVAPSVRPADTTNTHPDMVAGKKRKKVKRTDSYRIATNRQSVIDDFDEVAPLVRDSFKPGCVVRDPKYNTLPTRIETLASSDSSHKARKKKKVDTSDSDKKIQRGASQRSGTCPSPDTDDDQRSTQPERKKKSAFKRMKERLVLTFKRDRDNQKDKKKKRNAKLLSRKHTGARRVKPNHDGARKGFTGPDSGVKTAHEHDMDNSVRERLHEDHMNGGAIETLPGSKSPPRQNSFSLFQSIRNSISSKQAPPKYIKAGTPDTESSSPQQSRPTSRKRESSKPPLTLDIPKQPHHVLHEATLERDPEKLEEDDVITEIFDNIISRPVPRHCESDRRPGPDRTRLRLEGLRKCRPRSFDSGKSAPSSAEATRVSRTGYSFHSDLSPTVETDGGFDCIDAPTRTTAVSGDAAEEITEDEYQRRIDDVARRLAAMGDRINADKTSASAGSSLEFQGHMVGGPQKSSSHTSARTGQSNVGSEDAAKDTTEEEKQRYVDLINELRQFADTLNVERFQRQISVDVLPIIKNILAAQNYTGFRRIIEQEVSHTMGWEQVAWYTYLIKTTVCVAGTGQDLGRVVKDRAKRYFNSAIKPWIKSRPNGWESIHEETDIESDGELD